MDARQPHPFTRPPERTLVHNPNHPQTGPPPPPPPPQSQPFNSYPPAPAVSQHQQPFHAPYAQDPYPNPRRDPFFPPPSQHTRQGSYGVAGPEGTRQQNDGRQGGWGNTARHQPSHLHQQHSNGPPPPPPPPSMSSPHNPSNQSPYAPDASRRRSLGGVTPPNQYGGPSHEPPHPPPPPPSFPRSNMPPPLSPQQQQQQQQQQHASQTQRAPYSTAFGGRELPGLNQGHRPGSSMSISSLIGGGDTGAPAQTSQPQSSPHTNAPSSILHNMQPPSPRRGPPSTSRPDFQSFRRQPSPDRSMYGGAPRAQEGHGYSVASPRSYGPQGSPEQARPPQAQSSQPYKPMVFQGQRPYGASPNDAHPRDTRQQPANVPPRPNSQPGQDHSPYDPPNVRRTPYGPPEERRRTLGDSHHSRPNVAELVGGTSQTSDKDRPSTVQPVSQSTFSPPRDQRSAVGTNPSSRNPWRHTVPEEPLRELAEDRRDERPPVYRPFGGYSAPPQGPSPYVGPHGPEDMVRGRSLDHLSHRATEQYHAAPTSDPNSTDRHRPELLSRSLSSGGSTYAGRSLYGPDANRRTGRASPLPQAVQGAQAQPLSIGKDPHVKSEFGRMFSGLGGLGSSTPSRGSPMPQNTHDALPGTDLTEHLRLQRVSSQNGRKPKRVKDEDTSFDQDDVDGRGTPVGMRGAKRSKSTHPGHHHHHHTHHHHHHHHKPDEEMPTSYNPAFAGKQTSTPQNGNGQSHHHHHYHGGAHHHHHAPRANQPGLPSPKLTAKVHDVQAVLEEAAKLPRRHLGSQLYEASTQLPKPNSSVDDQFGYASKPKQLPRFDTNPVNCTFTIRVPRFYLKPRQRQQIVLQRHLWGAQIFRDNSDPIAAAIHSGWIRGEWDDTVNVGLLDPRITAPNAPSDAEDTLTKSPAAPVTPPADMDLQIDILILPRIQEYAGTVEYGISSRKSKTHDGFSYMIHKIRWVEEGVGSRGQERTAAAMKRRLDASAALLSLLSGGEESLRAVKGTTRLHA